MQIRNQQNQSTMILGIVLLAAFLSTDCHMNKETSTEPRTTTTATPDLHKVHFGSIAIDMHADTAQRLVDEQIDISTALRDGHLDAARMKQGGLDAQFFSIWVEPQFYGTGGASAVKRADDQIAAVRSMVEKHPENWVLALTSDDIRGAARDAKLAALMGLEGGYAIDEQVESVEKYYKLGVRYMSPAWSVSTSWAGSSGDDVGRTRGLSDFGKQVIREMNRVGMIVDVSHVSDKTFWDIIATTTKPVIASHSACRAIVDLPRNLDDEMIKAIAKTGGVVNVIFYPQFLEPGLDAIKKKVDAEIAPLVRKASDDEKRGFVWKHVARDRVRLEEFKKRLPPVTVSRLVDHIEHIVKLVGIEYVGLGSDFDGIQIVLSDLSAVNELPNLTNELLKRGYSEADIEKILGGNMLRVLDEAARH
jgi:membrane dipeptidase